MTEDASRKTTQLEFQLEELQELNTAKDRTIKELQSKIAGFEGKIQANDGQLSDILKRQDQ